MPFNAQITSFLSGLSASQPDAVICEGVCHQRGIEFLRYHSKSVGTSYRARGMPEINDGLRSTDVTLVADVEGYHNLVDYNRQTHIRYIISSHVHS